MKLTTFTTITFVCILALLSGCSTNPMKPTDSALDELNDRLETFRDLRQYSKADSLLDSIRKTGEVSEAWIAGQQGCTEQSSNELQEAGTLLSLALEDQSLKKQNYQSYLTIAMYAVANKIDQHKWEEALRLAEQVCRETRYSEKMRELLVAIRMYAYIGNCQVRLYNWKEARIIGENVYNICQEYERQDPAFARETFFCAMTIMEAYNGGNRWVETEVWTGRALSVLSRVPLFRENPQEQNYWEGYLNAIRSVALHHLGREQEAAEAFKVFEQSVFNQGLGALNAIFYLTATGQWRQVEKMIPRVDSLIVSMGAVVVPEYLEERYGYQYLVYRNLGLTDKVLAVTDSVFKYFRTSIDNERVSKALDLAKQYETQEKEMALAAKDRQLAIIWTGSIAGILFLLIIGLFLFIVNRRRSEHQLMEEHQKLVDAYDQLIVANARAEESAKMKNSFIRQISHEIRTPLNILSGFSQVLTNPQLDLDKDTKAEVNRSIVTNTQRITKLVNKMLELSDISSKTVIERSDEVLAGDIALQAIAEAGIQDVASVTFTMKAHESISNRMIKTNLRAAVRSLVLLLNNSHKFLNEPDKPKVGSVTLRIEADDAHSIVRFMVEDTGIGVPAEEAEHIFEEFVQLNDFYVGTGIGLTVARNLTRRIGGDIILDTTYQGGARFVMSLPLS